MENQNYLAHITEDGRKQTVLDHLTGTAKLSAAFAQDFNAEAQGALAGMLHDIGKYSQAFQRRLTEGAQKVDHSTAGAGECFVRKQPFAAFAIAGHHGGLPNGGSKTDLGDGSSFMSRMRRFREGKLTDYSAWSQEVTPSNPTIPQFHDNAEAMFFTRMLYSCLVDADFLDTEAFMSGKARETRAADFEALWKDFSGYTKNWRDPTNELNQKRQQILQSCIRNGSELSPGFFTLTVPTGGGKTAASLGFALAHAKSAGMTRIIYVVPYTSIIEQTAETFRKMLGDDQVLEHHSGLLYDMEDESGKKMAQATENWDIPVVVTTAVQFFESLYSNRSSKCRKLHSLAKSVIIFDEAQMLPRPYLRPCLWAIAQLVKNYGASAVLCTATQPALDGLLREFLPERTACELCPPELSQWAGFQRTRFEHIGTLSWDALAEEISVKSQALCIVNSRKSAGTLYEKLKAEGTFHLSTLMYPEHRRRQLAEIRYRLKEKLPCRVISTSLIEAGVDVDFPVVYREEAGLDSMIQAAGRCNREGKRPVWESIVTIFRSEGNTPKQFQAAVDASRFVMLKYSDFSTQDAIKLYFTQLLYNIGPAAQDQKGILPKMASSFFPFADIAEDFHLIDSNTRTVYIPLDEGESLVQQLREGHQSRELYRKLGRFGVSIYSGHFAQLNQSGALEVLPDGNAILLAPNLYSAETGLALEPDTSAVWMV